MVDDSTKELYEFSKAADVLKKSVTDLESITGAMRHSKLWMLFSRYSSGTSIWAIQNRLRAVAITINLALEKTTPQLSQLKKNMENLNKVSKLTEQMKPFRKSLFGSEDEEFFKFENRDINSLISLTKILRAELKDFEGIENALFGEKGVNEANKNELIELLSTTRTLYSEQEAALTLIENKNKKATARRVNLRKELTKRQEAGSSIGTTGTKFDNLRVKLLQKQLIASEYVGQISKIFKPQTWANFATFIGKGLLFFAKFMLGLSAILIGLVLLKNVFEGFKEPLSDAFEFIGEIISVAMDFLAITMGIVSEGIMDIKDALEKGDIILLLWGLLQVFGGAILTVLGGIVTAITVVIGGLLALIVSRLIDGFSSLKGFATLVLDTLQVIGVVAGIMILLGTTLASLPVLIIAAIAGVVAAVVKKMVGLSTGGIVNSNMQLVGEKGAELVSLPRGSRVHSNADSQRMLNSSGGNTIHVHVSGRVGASDAEIRDIANKIGKEINLKMMRTNNGVSFF
jgi:hypothetical protein